MMKQVIRNFFLITIFTIGLSSCTFEDSTEIESYFFTTTVNDWHWNSIYGRYECTFNFPELSGKIYEKGAITGTVFISEKNYDGIWYETQKTLPFSQTYMSRTVPYTETISFDVSPSKPATITFYIQVSDMKEVYLDTYNFKITLVYDI